MPHASDPLRAILNFNDLIHYLEEKLDWPLRQYGFDELTFEYQPVELGLKEEDAAKVRKIHQLRPLQHNQPWGIFFVEFENKKLPVVVLRRILSHLVIKKRASANKAGEAAWHSEDLMFITTFGKDDIAQREIAFAHFHQSAGDLPTLHVLGWDGGDTPLKLAHLDSDLQKHLHWPDNVADHHAWRQQWAMPFRHRIGHVIRTADVLAEVLASLARGINEKAIRMLAVESENGPLRKLYKSFQVALIHDLTEASFADTYAQTITYGLLTAAISRTEWSDGRHGTFIIAENVSDMVPITNPFLKEMLQTFLKVGGRKGGIDFDELGIQDVVELLRGDETDLPAILRDFGNRTPGEDPVIHFYEHFLSAYNKKLKIQRGVFYTPQPVVSYIIRSVHELLQTEFGLDDGLASTITWGEMIKRHPEITLPILTPKNPSLPGSKDIHIPSESPFVMILDIATGTGTFLVEVIDVIHKTMIAKWQKQGKREQEIVTLWNGYVPKHLLPRMYGYELMMAPYAIAHMKIGLKLSETDYQFMSDERVRVYLTNTLEPASDTQTKLVGILPALAHEAEAVNDVKRNVQFTVLVGNPPYSHRANLLSSDQRMLIDSYKNIDGRRMKVRGALQLERNLNDDYVKFMRFSQIRIEQAYCGIVGLITNNAYLENVTFPGMRNSLSHTFSVIDILNLNGSTKAGGVTPDGQKDENVFDIQQGVAISILAKLPCNKLVIRKYSELWGHRSDKEKCLRQPQFVSRDFSPIPEHFLFVPLNSKNIDEYLDWKSLDEIFSFFGTGVMTNRNGLTIAPTRNLLQEKINLFTNSELSDKDVSDSLGVKTNALWNLTKARNEIRALNTAEFFRLIDFRPFDTQVIFYHDAAIDNMRKGLMRCILQEGNLALIVSRQQFTQGFQHVLVARRTFDECFLSVASREKSSGFPMQAGSTLENGLQFDDNQGNIRDTFLPVLNSSSLTGVLRRKFNYIYAILYSPEYRQRYAEHLKRGYSRIPECSDLRIVVALSELGAELIALHFLESPNVNNLITRFTGKGDNSIPQKPTWKDNAVWINLTQRFEGVPGNVWNFHIGGYQVCEKWLKDRKGRTLSADDITHYQRIVVALNETIRIMADIDKVIDAYGGWPGAFQNGNVKDASAESSSKNVIPFSDRTPRAKKYDEPETPLFSLVAEPASIPDQKNESSDCGDTEKETRQSYEDLTREDLICLVRQLFGDGQERERDAAIVELARELGYQRTGSRIADELDDVIRTAVRRGIVENTGGILRNTANSIEQYNRDFLKDQFVSSLGGRQWIDREEAIRGFARWLGYLRTGKNIDETTRSLINGLIREGRIESDGTLIRKT